MRGLKGLAFSYLIVALVFANTQSASAAQPVSGVSTTVFNEGTDTASSFYNPVVVSNVNLTLPQDSFNALNTNTLTAVYQRASVVITTAAGISTTLNDIGVRLKGQASRTNLYGKAPLKLKFDVFVPNQKFMGLTRMTLNSMAQDPSFISETTAYRIYRAMGVVAPRTTYSWVTLNGQDFGLYANIESIDAQMLKRWLSPVHVYSSNCYGADMTYYQNVCYDTNYGDIDRTDLNSAVAVSVLEGEQWWTAVNKVADMKAVINLMAVDIYNSNWDGYTDVVQNNYFIVFDDTGKLVIVPWGLDQVFPIDPSAQLDWVGSGPPFRNFAQQRSVMLRKCMTYAPCSTQLAKAQVAVKDKVKALDIIGFKNSLAKVINQPYISKETRSNSNVQNAFFFKTG
jgi:spore coat protein CotH